jgi:hypothetical protein
VNFPLSFLCYTYPLIVQAIKSLSVTTSSLFCQFFDIAVLIFFAWFSSLYRMAFLLHQWFNINISTCDLLE